MSAAKNEDSVRPFMPVSIRTEVWLEAKKVHDVGGYRSPSALVEKVVAREVERLKKKAARTQ
jgi:hypothetical protein